MRKTKELLENSRREKGSLEEIKNQEISYSNSRLKEKEEEIKLIKEKNKELIGENRKNRRLIEEKGGGQILTDVPKKSIAGQWIFLILEGGSFSIILAIVSIIAMLIGFWKLITYSIMIINYLIRTIRGRKKAA